MAANGWTVEVEKGARPCFADPTCSFIGDYLWEERKKKTCSWSTRGKNCRGVQRSYQESVLKREAAPNHCLCMCITEVRPCWQVAVYVDELKEKTCHLTSESAFAGFPLWFKTNKLFCYEVKSLQAPMEVGSLYCFMYSRPLKQAFASCTNPAVF